MTTVKRDCPEDWSWAGRTVPGDQNVDGEASGE